MGGTSGSGVGSQCAPGTLEDDTRLSVYFPAQAAYDPAAPASRVDGYVFVERVAPQILDLVDEAAAKLRTEMESMPEELEQLERRLTQLEIEREALKKEKDEASRDRLSKLEVELGALETATPKVCGPVSGLVLNCHPEVPSDLATTCPSSGGLAAAFIQALQVMLPVICNKAGLPRSTKLLDPLKLNALPFLPPVVQVAP